MEGEPMSQQQKPQPTAPGHHAGHHGTVIAALAALLVLGAGVIYLALRPKEPVSPPVELQPPTAEEREAKEERQRMETLEAARASITAGDESGCAAIADEAQRASCQGIAIGGLAASSDDPSLCDRAPDEYWKSACLDHVIAYRAVVQGKPSLCDAMIVKERIPSCKAQAAPKE